MRPRDLDERDPRIRMQAPARCFARHMLPEMLEALCGGEEFAAEFCEPHFGRPFEVPPSESQGYYLDRVAGRLDLAEQNRLAKAQHPRVLEAFATPPPPRSSSEDRGVAARQASACLGGVIIPALLGGPRPLRDMALAAFSAYVDWSFGPRLKFVPGLGHRGSRPVRSTGVDITRGRMLLRALPLYSLAAYWPVPHRSPRHRSVNSASQQDAMVVLRAAVGLSRCSQVALATFMIAAGEPDAGLMLRLCSTYGDGGWPEMSDFFEEVFAIIRTDHQTAALPAGPSDDQHARRDEGAPSDDIPMFAISA